MSRVPLVDPEGEETDPKARRMLEALYEANGAHFNIMREVAHHPDIMRGFTNLLSAAYQDNSLTERQRELGYFTAAVVNECHY